MPNTPNTQHLTVVGTDGQVPVYEPDGVWKIWGYHEVYFGKEGKNKYVPKVGDYVEDTTLGKTYIVIAVDKLTLIPTLRDKRNEVETDMLHPDDKYLVTGRVSRAETFRVFLDTSVTPFTMTIDSRYTVKGSWNHHFCLFHGDYLTANAKPISMIFDNRGTLLTQDIPLELVAMPSHVNHAIKSPQPFHTNVELPDGELVTGVVYNDAGGVVSIRQFVVENTAVIRQRDLAQKYVVDITLESPFMSEADPNVLLYPLNTTLNSLNLFGVVHYSDGSKRRLPVDGTKFSVLGLQSYIASIISYPFEFDLKYNLDTDEAGVSLQPGIHLGGMNSRNGKFMTRHYSGRVVKPDNMYTVKLYGYPEWNKQTESYDLRWFMMDLTRSGYVDVTPYVSYNSTAATFNGTSYGLNQRLSVSLNLRDVNPQYKNYIHTQVVDIQLRRPASDKTGYPWSVGFSISQQEYFGVDNWAECTINETDYKRLYIGLHADNKQAWLDRIWKRTLPVYDEYSEGGAPEPDMFKLIVPGSVRGEEYTFNINQWNQVLEVRGLFENTSNVYVVFFKRMPDTDLYTGISALPIFIM